MNAKEPHDILGVSTNAGVVEIRQAYRQMALKWHPDKHTHGNDKEHAIEMFAEITNAYQALLHDLDRPTRPAASKLRTRLPTPAPSFGSSGQSPTSTTSSSVSQLATPQSKEDSFHILPHFNKKAKENGLNEPSHKFEQLFDHSVSKNQISSRDINGPGTPHRKPTLTSRPLPQQRGGSPPPYPTFSQPDQQRDNNHGVYDRSKKLFSQHPGRNPMVVRYLNVDDNPQLFTPGPPLRSVGFGPSGEWAYCLTLTLEELFNGKHCRFCVVRNFLSGRSKNVIIEIDIPPGCQDGTRILCQEVGHELTPRRFQDVTFIIEEAPHSRFSRVHDDLYLNLHLAWTDFSPQQPKKVVIVGIDGEEIGVIIDCMRGNALTGELKVRGAGMIIRDGGGLHVRGNLVIRWEVQAPQTKIRQMLGRFWFPRGRTR